MRARTPLMVLLVFALFIGALGVGFVAGRRIPRGLSDRVRARLGLSGASVRDLPSPWKTIEPAPFQVVESAVRTVDGIVYVFGGFKDPQIRATAAVWAFDPAQQKWTRRHDMPRPWTHSPPTLLDGKLWFAGGFLGDSPGPATSDVWRYDPAGDTWTPGPPLPAVRGGGALVSLNGKLHYFGGFGADREAAMGDHWVLVPSSADSLHWTSAAALPIPRGHLMGVALDGAIYAIGGTIGHDPYPRDVAWVHRYDPATDQWSEVATLPIPRSHFEPGTFVMNGRIVIVGGRSRPTGRESVSDVTEYDPVLNRWRALPSLPGARHSPVAAVVPDGIIAGAGGTYTGNPDTRAFWRYHPEMTWYRGDSLPVALGEVAGGVIGDRLYLVGEGSSRTLALDLRTGRWDEASLHAVRLATGSHHAAEVWNNQLYLFGGLTFGQGAVQIYDPITEAWRLGPYMPFRAGSSASALIGGQMYVAGGIVNDSTTRLAARFDPRIETWTPIAPMPKARNHAAAATDGLRLFVFGGRGPGSGDSNVVANGFADVQIYDPAVDTWTASGDGPNAPAPLPQARGGMGKAVYANGEFWVFGGETLNGPGATASHTYARVDVYDPRTNRWRAGPVMPTARHGIFPLLDDGRIYLSGGGLVSGLSDSPITDILILPPPAP